MAVQNYGYLKTIWDGLMLWVNNEYGVAALMGNLYAESGCVPFRVQGDYTFPFTYSQNYTNRVDQGIVTEYSFVNNAPDASHAKGYGLAQWTSSNRKQNYYNLYRSGGYASIGGVDLGLAMLQQELDTGGDYASSGNAIKNATDIRSASDYILIHYEAPKDQSEAVKILRASYGQEIYNMYHSGGGNPDPPTPDPPPPPYPDNPTTPHKMGLIYYMKKL